MNYDTNVMSMIVNSERNLVMKLLIAMLIGDVHDSWTEAEEKGVGMVHDSEVRLIEMLLMIQVI